MSVNIIATSFYLDNKSRDKYKTENYFKCICVFFASLNVHNKTEDKVLFVNFILPDIYLDLLNNLGVRIIVIEGKDIQFTNDTYFNNDFPGCLFKLDVLFYVDRHLREQNDKRKFLLIDNDCLFLDNITFDFINYLGIAIDYPADKIVNGYSRVELSEISKKISLTKPVIWFGGELIGIDLSVISDFNSSLSILWDFFKSNVSSLSNNLTEEHLISILFTNLSVTNSERLIKRIWTTYGYNNVSGDEREFSILHYPSEKNLYFLRLFNLIEREVLCFEKYSKAEYQKLLLYPTMKFQRFSFFFSMTSSLSKLKQFAIRYFVL